MSHRWQFLTCNTGLLEATSAQPQSILLCQQLRPRWLIALRGLPAFPQNLERPQSFVGGLRKVKIPFNFGLRYEKEISGEIRSPAMANI